MCSKWISTNLFRIKEIHRPCPPIPLWQCLWLLLPTIQKTMRIGFFLWSRKNLQLHHIYIRQGSAHSCEVENTFNKQLRVCLEQLSKWLKALLEKMVLGSKSLKCFLQSTYYVLLAWRNKVHVYDSLAILFTTGSKPLSANLKALPNESYIIFISVKIIQSP